MSNECYLQLNCYVIEIGLYTEMPYAGGQKLDVMFL